MQYAALETAALAHVDDIYYYDAYCGKCRHHARLSLEKLRARLSSAAFRVAGELSGASYLGGHVRTGRRR